MRTDDRGTFAPRAASNWALALLLLVSLMNYLDRFVVGVLLPAIKADLHLSDTQLGFVTGVAFAVFYALAGIPIGHLADRCSRRTIIGCALALWSAMTIACGFAHSFLQLVLARILLGVGEAGSTSPSHSLISDLFPARSRASALALFSTGMPIGILVGFLVGGYAAEALGWRGALMMFGAPGLVLALVVMVALPEPTRGAADAGGLHSPEPLPLRRALGVLVRRRSFVFVCLGSGCYTVVWSGLIIWLPSYFTRGFEVPMKDAGAALAVVLGTSQLLGLLAGGALADRLGQRDARWAFWTCALGASLSLPCFAIALFWPHPVGALIALFPAFFVALFQGGPAAAIVQAVAGPSMRAVSVSIYLVVINMVSALGTQLIGLFSDRMRLSHGTSALGASMLLVTILFGLGATLSFLLGARSFAGDREEANNVQLDAGPRIETTG